MKEEGRGSLSPNNIRIRIKDRRYRAAHSPHPQPFSALPTFPHCILGAHIYFLFIPTWGGGCLPNPNLGRSGWNYLSWHNQIMAPFGFRSGIGCKVYHGSPSLPFPRAPLSRMELSTSPWLPFPDSTEAVFQKSSGSCVHVQRLWGSSLRKSYLPQDPPPPPPLNTMTAVASTLPCGMAMRGRLASSVMAPAAGVHDGVGTAVLTTGTGQ